MCKHAGCSQTKPWQGAASGQGPVSLLAWVLHPLRRLLPRPRCRVHECNVDDLMAAALPYHETEQFVRLVQVRRNNAEQCHRHNNRSRQRHPAAPVGQLDELLACCCATSAISMTVHECRCPPMLADPAAGSPVSLGIPGAHAAQRRAHPARSACAALHHRPGKWVHTDSRKLDP